MQRILYIIVLLCLVTAGNAQFLEVVGITVEGNKRTKERIILREMDFHVGDRIQQSLLAERLESNEKLVLRSGLFTSVEMNVGEWDTDADEISIIITVREGPMIIPLPIFELADRNFNVWWNEFNASFKRVNYGAQVYVVNPWGIGQRFKLAAQGGYTPRFEFSALLPFLDYSQSVRMEVDASYSQNREIAMLNVDNKLGFFTKDEQTIFKRQNYSLGLLLRYNVRTQHTFRISYQNNWIDQQLTEEVNPDFFLEGRSRQQFIAAEYELLIDHRDIPVFPRKGWRTRFKFRKEGFGLFDSFSSTYISPLIEYNHPITKNLSIGSIVRAQIALEREQQPYYNYKGLGYEDAYVRGYELYVVDGLDYVLFQNMVSYRVWNTLINWKKLMPVKSLKLMPFQVFVSAHYDTGYSNDPFYSEGNSFTNRWLHGGGIALNLMMYNTFALRIEGSINHLGEKGIFLQSNTVF